MASVFSRLKRLLANDGPNSPARTAPPSPPPRSTAAEPPRGGYASLGQAGDIPLEDASDAVEIVGEDPVPAGATIDIDIEEDDHFTLDQVGEEPVLAPDVRMKIKLFASRINKLDSFPVAARRIIQVCRDPNSSAGQLVQAVEGDVSIASVVLRYANSPLFGARQEIQNLQRAVTLLGFQSIRDIAVSAAIGNLFASSDPLLKSMWEHSLAVAAAARSIAREVARGESEDMLIAGLLHDLGRMAMFQEADDDERRIWHEHASTGRSLTEAEVATYGFRHDDLGGEVAQAWNLSGTIALTAHYHHHPVWASRREAVTPQQLTTIACVSLADRLCHALEAGVAPAALRPCEASILLGVPADRLASLTRSVQSSIEGF